MRPTPSLLTHRAPPPISETAMATRNPNLSNNISALKRAAAAVVAAGGADAELHGQRGEWWWTGRKPWECPGFDSDAGVLRCVCCACVSYVCVCVLFVRWRCCGVLLSSSRLDPGVCCAETDARSHPTGVYYCSTPQSLKRITTGPSPCPAPAPAPASKCWTTLTTAGR